MEFSHKLDAYSSGIFTQLKEGRERLAARGVEVIDLGVGTPDLPPAPHIMEALLGAAAKRGVLGFTAEELCRVIDEKIPERFRALNKKAIELA